MGHLCCCVCGESESQLEMEINQLKPQINQLKQQINAIQVENIKFKKELVGLLGNEIKKQCNQYVSSKVVEQQCNQAMENSIQDIINSQYEFKIRILERIDNIQERLERKVHTIKIPTNMVHIAEQNGFITFKPNKSFENIKLELPHEYNLYINNKWIATWYASKGEWDWNRRIGIDSCTRCWPIEANEQIEIKCDERLDLNAVDIDLIHGLY